MVESAKTGKFSLIQQKQYHRTYTQTLNLIENQLITNHPDQLGFCFQFQLALCDS